MKKKKAGNGKRIFLRQKTGNAIKKENTISALTEENLHIGEQEKRRPISDTREKYNCTNVNHANIAVRRNNVPKQKRTVLLSGTSDG